MSHPNPASLQAARARSDVAHRRSIFVLALVALAVGVLPAAAALAVRQPAMVAGQEAEAATGLPTPGAEGQEHQHHGAAGQGEIVALGDLQVPDAVVLDQDGNEVRFYSELIAGKVVAMNFVFTTCTTICPPMGANFARLRRILDERGEDSVHLISVSVDPLVDTPARMKAWGARFGAGPGWTLVTGDKPVIDELLKGLGVFTPDKLDHSPTLLIGNDATGDWTRAHGLASPAELAGIIAGVREGDNTGEGTQAGGPTSSDALVDLIAGVREGVPFARRRD